MLANMMAVRAARPRFARGDAAAREEGDVAAHEEHAAVELRDGVGPVVESGHKAAQQVGRVGSKEAADGVLEGAGAKDGPDDAQKARLLHAASLGHREDRGHEGPGRKRQRHEHGTGEARRQAPERDGSARFVGAAGAPPFQDGPQDDEEHRHVRRVPAADDVCRHEQRERHPAPRADEQPDRPHEQREQDERVHPHGVAQVGGAPEAPRVAKRQHGRMPADQPKATAKVERGRKLDAPQLERVDHKGKERQMVLVKEQEQQVERTGQVVAVQAPRVGAQAAGRRVEDGLLAGKHAAIAASDMISMRSSSFPRT